MPKVVINSSSPINDDTATSLSTTAILTSLPLLDEIRADPQVPWFRAEGSNLDVLEVESYNASASSEQTRQPQRPLALCHLSALLPFTLGDKIPVPDRFEDAAAIALAAHHLNVGDGTLVPQVQGLNETCNIRFTVEYTDTEYQPSTALDRVLEILDRRPPTGVDTPSLDRLPCAFVGAQRSSVSIPTSIVTGLKGYPQVSARSTSAELDDKYQYPLFARTVPSDHGNALPIVMFLNQVLGVRYLAVININDAYGNSFVQGLRTVAANFTPDMQIQQFSVDDDPASIALALDQVKHSEYRYILAVIFTMERYDHMFQTAYEMGMAGSETDYQWFLGDSFAGINGREFDADSVLPAAYTGVGQIKASGGIHNVGLQGYETFVSLIDELNNPDDLGYLYSLIPWHTDVAMGSLDFENFSLPTTGSNSPFAYEAAIALGLAACQVLDSDTTTTTESEGVFLNGTEHYQKLVNSVFQGVNGEVVFDPNTGSRDPSYTFYRVSNSLPGATLSDGSVVFSESFTHIFQNKTWREVTPFVFADGTTTIPADVPPAQTVVHSLSTGVIAGVLLLCAVMIALALGFMSWTHVNRKSRVVLASQPFFLDIICIGVFILGCTLVPMVIDHRIADIKACSRACTAVPWLATLGYSMTVCALFTKTHRVNIILNTANKLKRIKVTIWDVAKPMLALVSVDLLLLCLMTTLSSPQYVLVEEGKDQFGRPTGIRGKCTYDGAIPYLATLGCLNFLALLLTICQSYKARNLSTEFSESAYIFKALLAISLVAFVGGPVLVLAGDNANAFVFVLSAILFVAGTSILLLLFVPKMEYLRAWKTKKAARVRVSGIGQGSGRGNSISFIDSSLDSTEEFTGMKILTTKTPEKLLREVEELKRLLESAKTDVESGGGRESSQRVLYHQSILKPPVDTGEASETPTPAGTTLQNYVITEHGSDTQDQGVVNIRDCDSGSGNTSITEATAEKSTGRIVSASNEIDLPAGPDIADSGVSTTGRKSPSTCSSQNEEPACDKTEDGVDRLQLLRLKKAAAMTKFETTLQGNATCGNKTRA